MSLPLGKKKTSPRLASALECLCSACPTRTQAPGCVVSRHGIAVLGVGVVGHDRSASAAGAARTRGVSRGGAARCTSDMERGCGDGLNGWGGCGTCVRYGGQRKREVGRGT
ncbi:hypothetical protein BDU57DRAFT_528469 [Ampelomyces quisqualis]|uniref:Uncharacterized protein n=1 Tax=Ampelomyces quisqualis TaxID=50730 RepID=A0A6A5QTP6_AMPQU|nr:hypothetical protein BDU57DRAFT_528469 [Ampelomyces quisqualis]